jgi:hypothetical protein
VAIILPESATDAEIIAAIEDWLRLLEREDYEAAVGAIGSRPPGEWTAKLLRDCVNYHGYSDRNDHRVTLTGVSRDRDFQGRVLEDVQEKDVHRNDGGEPFHVWYQLCIDGFISDQIATFDLERVPQGLRLHLEDICVR